jgi:hypothetical protein
MTGQRAGDLYVAGLLNNVVPLCQHRAFVAPDAFEAEAGFGCDLLGGGSCANARLDFTGGEPCFRGLAGTGSACGCRAKNRCSQGLVYGQTVVVSTCAQQQMFAILMDTHQP